MLEKSFDEFDGLNYRESIDRHMARDEEDCYGTTINAGTDKMERQ